MPGSDVFSSQMELLYKNEINRDAFIVSLNREAYKAFTDTIMIGQYPALQFGTESVNMWRHRRREYRYLEDFKIAVGFELHLKACLVANDIVVHLIANTPSLKALRKRQREEPVYTHELLTIEGFYYNGNHNVLLNRTQQSLSFDQILNIPAYRSRLGKPQDLLDVIDDYRNLRNQIHFPGDVTTSPHLSKYTDNSMIKLLVSFINSEIVEYNNKLIDKWTLHPAQRIPPLEIL